MNKIKRAFKYINYLLIFFILFCLSSYIIFWMIFFSAEDLNKEFVKLLKHEEPFESQEYYRRHHYKNYSIDKKSETIRVGIFGDSFSAGSDIVDDESWVSLLNSWYTDEGLDVEVINFAMAGAGFHPNFKLWEEKAKQYSLDYVVFGPTIADLDKRDLTFNFSINFANIDQRFSLKALKKIESRYRKNSEGKTVLVKPVGKTNLEKIINYWSFIPHYQYLIYDDFYPISLRAPLVPILKKLGIRRKNTEIEIKNKQIKKEKLLEIAKSVKRLIYMDYICYLKPNPLKDLLNLTMGNVDFLEITYKQTAFDKTLGWHDSAIKHYQKAARLYNHLNLSPKNKNIYDYRLEYQGLKTDDINKDTLKKSADLVQVITQSKARLAELYDRSRSMEEFCLKPHCSGKNNSISETDTVIVLLNQFIGKWEFEAVVFRDNFDVKNLYYELRKGDKKLKRGNLGLLQTKANNVYLWDSMRFFSFDDGILRIDNTSKINKVLQENLADSFSIYYNKKEILKAKYDSRGFEVVKNKLKFMYFCAPSSSNLTFEETKDKERVYLRLMKNNVVLDEIDIGLLQLLSNK